MECEVDVVATPRSGKAVKDAHDAILHASHPLESAPAPSGASIGIEIDRAAAIDESQSRFSTEKFRLNDEDPDLPTITRHESNA